MRTCLGIFFGIIFLIVSSFFILTLNLDKTVYNAKFDKQVLDKSEIYKNLPLTLVDAVSQGKISTSDGKELSPATKNAIINIVNNVLTPDVLKRHSESLIDKMLSDEIVITEDFSDINDAVNSKIGKDFAQSMGVAITENKDNTFVPKILTIDKSKDRLGQSIIYHKKALWISLSLTVLFLILLFFSSADNYKSRLKWVGGFMAAATVFAVINYLIIRFFSFDWIINLINSNTEQAWISNISSQAIAVLARVKAGIAFYYLIELISLVFLAIMLFVISAIIPAKQTSTVMETSSSRGANINKEAGNVPKKS